MTKQQQLLIIEDDQEIAEMVIGALSREGFLVQHAMNGEQAFQLMNKHRFDLLLLDLMLPGGMDGLEILKRVRSTERMPILILSAKDSELDKALGLGFGADDYIAKPFSLIELTARVKAALRRATDYSSAHPEPNPHGTVHRVHELELNADQMQVTKRDQEVRLTAKEYAILHLLISNPKRAFSKEQIYRSVWNDDYYSDENAIQVHISRLREKIEDDPASPQYIKTVWGIGYKLGEF